MAKTTKKATNAKIGRPPGRRQVLALRLHESVRQKLQNAANGNNNTMAAEAERRIEKSFEWDRAVQTAEQWQRKQEAALKKGLKAALQGEGYTLISTPRGNVWTEPGYEFSVEAFEDAIERIVLKAILELNRKKT